ncbi:hypothetical protein GC169_05145 [bacterium]|nr:hypothetical protein [bacterium]
MTPQIPKSAIMSTTLRFLTAGGLTLAVAVIQEIIKADTDWGLVATMIAGILVGVGGGAYGRVTAAGPILTLFPRRTEGGAQ